MSGSAIFSLYLLSPWRLLLLIVPFAFVAFVVYSQRKTSTTAIAFSSLEMLEGLVEKPQRWRQLLPVVLVASSLGLGVVGIARPASNTTDTSSKAVVVLAIDVSLSMSATDVAPSRIEVAKASALKFVDKAPNNTLIGVVAFDSTARQIIAATDNRAAVTRVISSLQPGTGTAIGEAIYTALDTIESAVDTGSEGKNAGTIILLSDGTTTTGRPDADAAADAQSAGVKVNTIAFGTDEGTVTTPDGQVVPVPPDEVALGTIADIARGKSFTATTAKDLQEIYESLGDAVVRQTDRKEYADIFTFLCVILFFVASVLSTRWFRRVI
jgi:Ca-activated chloride channel family protein